MIKTRTRSERRPRIGDKYCLTGSAEVLTSKGWKNITEITMDDEVATLKDNKYLAYEKPIDVYKFDYNGQMYKLKSRYIDLDVTIDHELYARKRYNDNYELISAKDVKGKFYNFKKWAINNYPDIEYITIPECEFKNKIYPEKNIKMDDYLDLLGIFIADGSIYEDRIGISGAKQRKINHLFDISKKLDFKVISETDKKNEWSHLNNVGLTANHYIINPQMAKFLEPLNVGATNKYLPDYVWNLSQRQSNILLNSLISGDGSIRKNGTSMEYYTSSKNLANDIEKLAIHCGLSGITTVTRKKGFEHFIKGRKLIATRDELRVGIVKAHNEPSINHGHHKHQNGQSEEIYDYKGNVYCLEVSSHVFMIRENNKNVWIGNCSRHKQLCHKVIS